jgi:hypothetical protein
MNRVLFKAAAIVNIAAAALIYVACSGDDGKDGAQGASCNAVANTVTGGYDIVCGGVVAGNVKDGEQGPPGTAVAGACTGTPVETGISITCNGVFAGIVTNGLPGPQGPAGPGGGGGGPGACDVTPVNLPDANGQGIKLDCAGGLTSTILICQEGEKANGLLINTDGMEGYCDDAGKIQRSGGLLRCGGDKIDLRREFCQRTVAAAGANKGKFASIAVSGGSAAVTSIGSYPNTGALIVNPNSDAFPNAYHLGEDYPALITSKIVPLCGYTAAAAAAAVVLTTPIADNPAAAFDLHNGRVYDATKYCARNLLKLNTDTAAFSLTPSQGGYNTFDKNNTLATSGASDTRSRWAILDTALAYFEAGYAGNEAVRRDALWDFYFASLKEPYSQCPAGNIVSLDNYKCVPIASCVYYSTIDNTCYQTKASADAVVVTLGTPNTTWIDPSKNPLPTGIQKYNLNSNKWSTSCRVGGAQGFVYYAVNDMRLKIRTEQAKDAQGNPLLDAQGNPVLRVGCPATGEALSIEDTFECIKSDGTVDPDYKVTTDVPAFAGQSFDKPLHCVSNAPCTETSVSCVVDGTIKAMTTAQAADNTYCKGLAVYVASVGGSGNGDQKCELNVNGTTTVVTGFAGDSDDCKDLATFTPETTSGANNQKCELNANGTTTVVTDFAGDSDDCKDLATFTPETISGGTPATCTLDGTAKTGIDLTNDTACKAFAIYTPANICPS